jgi:glycosyltransferase involved in cell wall biosynthesis
MNIPDVPLDEVTLNLPDKELPSVSIVMPCYQRRRFIPLIIANINNQDYPKEKLELCILQDGDQDLFVDKLRYEKFKEAIYPVKLSYKYEPNIRRTIGNKRNILVKQMASHKFIANMDSDDIYMNTYIRYSINALKQHKKGISTSVSMLFVYPHKDFIMSAITCGFKAQGHEGCSVFTKKHFQQFGGFGKSQTAEGVKMLSAEERVLNLNITKLMVCVSHNIDEGNTVKKEQFITNDRIMEHFDKNSRWYSLIKEICMID